MVLKITKERRNHLATTMDPSVLRELSMHGHGGSKVMKRHLTVASPSVMVLEQDFRWHLFGIEACGVGKSLLEERRMVSVSI